LNFPEIWEGGKDKNMTKETKKHLDTYLSQHYQWLEKNIRDNIAKGKMCDYVDDLLHQQIIEIYNSKDEEKIAKMLVEDKLRWYILTCAGFSLRSSTSPFYKIHRQQKFWSRENYIDGGGEHDSHSGLGILDKAILPEDDYDKMTLYDCSMKALENMFWYNRTLMVDYFIEGETLPQMYKKYNISKGSLVKDINVGINIIRTKCNHC